MWLLQGPSRRRGCEILWKLRWLLPTSRWDGKDWFLVPEFTTDIEFVGSTWLNMFEPCTFSMPKTMVFLCVAPVEIHFGSTPSVESCGLHPRSPW